MVKNILIKNIITVIVLCFLFSCSDNKKNITDKEITIKMVTHGQATDPFWSVVSNGAKDAAKQLGVNLHYQSPQNFDMITMSQMIDAVVATKPDGLIISVPDIPALKKKCYFCIKKQYPNYCN